jgi:hypothetical protein
MLLFGVIAGGIYLYYKVERLDQEIARHRRELSVEGEDDQS